MRVFATIFGVLLLISTSVCRAEEDTSGPHQLRLAQQLQQPNEMQRLRPPARLRERPSIAPPAASRRVPGSAVPHITTPSPLPLGTVGQFYRQALAATGGKAPYVFILASGKFPPGLTITDNKIVGTPTGLGSTFVVRVIDSNKLSSTKSFALTVRKPLTPPVPVEALKIVTPSPLASGTVGVSYSQLLVASGGKPPYVFSLASGVLPYGLSLKGTQAMLSGTPTDANTWTFGLTVTDSASQTETKSFSLTTKPKPTITTPNSLPDAAIGKPYSQAFAATGGTPPYTFFPVGGGFPPGLKLNGAVLEGTPTAVGSEAFQIGVRDVVKAESIHNFYLHVNPLPVITTPNPLPDGHVGASYNLTFEAGGGKTPYEFSLGSGVLPDGLTLSGATLSGAPTAAGKSSFVLAVKDANKNSNTKTFSVVITEAPKITTASPLPAGQVGFSYKVLFGAEKGTEPYTFSLASGTLPAGVTLTKATLAGTPTTAGVSSFTIKVTDSTGAFSTKAFSAPIVAADAPLPATITSGALKVVGIGAVLSDPNALPLPSTIVSSPLKVVGIGAVLSDPNAPPLPSTIVSGPLKVVGPEP